MLHVTAFLLPLAAALPAHAAEELASTASRSFNKGDLGITAVVGEDAISSYDVENRIKFIIATARISDSPDVLRHIRPQVIRSLIDERLQVQAAEKNGLKVSDQEIKEAIAAIEEQRNMPPGTIYSILAANNVPKESFTSQIKAQLLWNKLLSRKVRPNVQISDAEITLASRKFSMTPPKKADVVPQEYKIAVIALPVDKPSGEGTVQALAQKLVQQLRGGASFEEISRQFSSVTASAGGKVETFWVRLNQLDPAVAKSLSGAQTGTITSPVRTAEGFTIIKVFDMRAIGGKKKPKPEKEQLPKDTEVSLKEILLELKPDADEKEADVMLQIGAEVAKHPGTCDDKTVANISDVEDFDIEVNFLKFALSEMPPDLKAVVDTLEMGEISPPIATYDGIRLYMLCGKKETEDKLVNREQVYTMLLHQKMELEAQKYMRDLRRETFIDVR
jgi:peptidyl-prolyl cis-trans isomerase SurA